VKFGISLSTLHPGLHLDATLEAERLGFESVWLAEHLVFPVDMSGSPHPGADTPPVPPSVPVYDAFAYLCYLAGRTSRIRLGTNVYLLGLRHPFVAARAVQTLDVVSGGRAEVGIGAGWLRSEWTAAGLDPRTRGRRLDEALSVCKRLWTEEVIAHHGEFYSFDSVMFEPKPIQKPWPKIHVGGESQAALRRAAAHADGWFGLVHTPESASERVAELRRECAEAGRSEAKLEVTLSVTPGDPDEVQRFAAAGVDRLVVSPWRRSRECISALRRFAEAHSIACLPDS
jgi:probable F420-dependent oxidoreductase